jgi:serine/threonine-protein kinase RsbW
MSTPTEPTASGTGVEGGTVVSVNVPADVSYVSTLRLTTASLAARCGLTVDDIEDLRLAVDEACALLLPHAIPGTTLDTRFRLSAGELAVDATVVSVDGADPDRSGFAWTVLGALASDVDVLGDGDRLTIVVTKRSEAPPT